MLQRGEVLLSRVRNAVKGFPLILYFSLVLVRFMSISQLHIWPGVLAHSGTVTVLLFLRTGVVELESVIVVAFAIADDNVFVATASVFQLVEPIVFRSAAVIVGRRTLICESPYVKPRRVFVRGNWGSSSLR